MCFAKKLFRGGGIHGLRTPNKGINQKYLKNCADVADKICLPLNTIWDLDWIFGRAVKAISSLSVRSPWLTVCGTFFVPKSETFVYFTKKPTLFYQLYLFLQPWIIYLNISTSRYWKYLGCANKARNCTHTIWFIMLEWMFWQFL